MELTWQGRFCIRLRGRDATVVADPFLAEVGPTGRGLTADVVTFSHGEPSPAGAPKRAKTITTLGDGHVIVPSSLEHAFVLDSPGEYEVRDILITGVRTYRDERSGADRGPNVAFVYELDGLHTCHLGDVGHLLTQDELGELGPIDVVCVPIGGHLGAAKAAELVAQLDPRLVVPLAVGASESDCDVALARFLHEMGVKEAIPQARLSVTPSSLPGETTLVLIEPRGRG
ncbi:MAG: hypothetical protein A2X23_08795 [Chloroflexi bacterium GWC2_73_18]|nr:MAG: hypothetical protein A2X23_08795 [Chloroflexi bacterium GWC2_73_18]